MSSIRSKLLSTVSALAVIGTAGIVSAQEATDTEIDEIVVTGIRGSLQQSLAVKRASNAIVDVITSEDIGKFPDRNVAESLQRISGVTIQRQFGEGSDVSIRGAGSGFTLTTLNGQNVASTGWFVLEPARRSFNYELLPSELVGSIEVYKSSQADLAEGGVGGTVQINTRKPLDMDSLSLYGSVEGQHQSDSDTIDPQFSGMVSWKNEDETIGILLAGVHQRRNLQRQGNEAFWEWGAGPVAFEQKRERTGLAATIQFRPSENLDLVINAMDLKMRADNTNYALWLTQGNHGWSGIPVDPSDQLNGTTAHGPLGVAFLQMRPREATMNTKVYDATLEYSGDDYVLSLQAGHTKSSGGTDFEMVLDDGTAQSLAGSTYDFMGGEQTWNLVDFDMASYVPDSFAMGTGPNFNRTPKTDKETYFQADVEMDMDLGIVSSIKGGVKYSDHKSTSRKFDFTQDPGFVPSISTSGLVDGTIDAGAGDYTITAFDIDAIKDWAKASIIGETEDLGASSAIHEKNFAAYVMATFEGDGFRGNAGVRYIHTKASSPFYVDGTWNEDSASYSEFLPSVNVAMDVAEDVILRVSAARVLTRPQYVDLYKSPDVRGSNDDLPNNQFWIVGNVGLKPFISDQFDLGLEYYFAEGSLMSATFFMKDVKNFVNRIDSHADTADIPFDLPDADEAAAGWTVQELVNGRSATLHGFELQYQQDYGNGFGSIVNYTYTDSKTEEDTFADMNPVVSDSSKHAYNVSGYYEGDMFQTRLSYNYRSKYMLREVGAYGNRLHEGYGSLDLSASWYATENISVNLDVNNILAEDSVQIGNHQPSAPGSGFTAGFPLYQYETARRITLGVSAKF